MDRQLTLPRLKHLRQSQIKQSNDGHVISTKRLCSAQNQRAEQPFIYKLPGELLLEITEWALVRDVKGRRHYNWMLFREEKDKINYTQLKTLCTISKFFNSLVTPLLYHNIIFHDSIFTHPIVLPVFRLHRTLKANPGLRQWCKVLDIRALKDMSQHLTFATDILSWLTNVRTLKVHDEFNQLCDAVTQMPQLKSLSLGPTRRHYDRTQEEVFVNTLARYLMFAPILYPIYRPEEGTAPFTSLWISDIGIPFADISSLIRWPKRLEHLTIDQFSFHNRHSKYAAGHFESTLSVHQHTLKSLRLSQSRESPYDFIDLSTFPLLNTLHCSMYDVTGSPNTAASRLLAPNLHTLVLDYRRKDQYSESIHHFQRTEASWLQEFCHTAVKVQAALKTIKILFRPYPLIGPIDGYESPWELLEGIATSMKSSGLNLEYTPTWTKELWASQEIYDIYPPSPPPVPFSGPNTLDEELEQSWRIEIEKEFRPEAGEMDRDRELLDFKEKTRNGDIKKWLIRDWNLRARAEHAARRAFVRRWWTPEV